jgi:PKHD-type hydroxylase
MKLLYPYISYKEVIKPDICQKIISLGLSNIEKNKKKGISTHGYTLNEKHKNHEGNKVIKDITLSDKTNEEIKKEGFDLDQVVVRDSEICWLKDKFLYDLILPLIGKANKEAGWNWNIDTAETFQFTVYHGRKEDGGFYGWHSDGSSDFNSAIRPAIKVSDNPLAFKPPKKNSNGKFITDTSNKIMPDMEKEDLPLKKDKSGLIPIFSQDNKKWGKVRKISMTLNLTDPNSYEGGNLKFDLGPHVKGNRIKVCDDSRSQGSLIVFPSFMYHCVTPVISGTRFSLVLWCLGKPWQ